MLIRKAIAQEVGDIYKLLNHNAEQGLLLPRSLSELYDHLRDFSVIEDGDTGIIAVCALGICWEDLGEIRSLAVEDGYHGKRFGTQLVEHCLEEAVSLGLKKIFVLTYVPKFFISSFAVFSPIPGTPGILSVWSPIRANKSGRRVGLNP